MKWAKCRLLSTVLTCHGLSLHSENSGKVTTSTSKPRQGSKRDYPIRSPVAGPEFGLLTVCVHSGTDGSSLLASLALEHATAAQVQGCAILTRGRVLPLEPLSSQQCNVPWLSVTLGPSLMASRSAKLGDSFNQVTKPRAPFSPGPLHSALPWLFTALASVGTEHNKRLTLTLYKNSLLGQ